MSLGLLQKLIVRFLPPFETLPPDDDDAKPERAIKQVKSNKWLNFWSMSLAHFIIIPFYLLSCISQQQAVILL